MGDETTGQKHNGKPKKQKTPNETQICNKLIKSGELLLYKKQINFYTKILIGNKTSKEWKQSVTIPLFKKKATKGTDPQ